MVMSLGTALRRLNDRFDIDHRLLQRSYRTPWLQVTARLVELTHFRTKQRRRRALGALPPDREVAAAADALRRQGFAVATELSDAAVTRPIVEAGVRLAGGTAVARAAKKTHWQPLLDRHDANAASAFYRFALQPRLLALVAHAMGEPPLLVSVGLHRSVPSSTLSHSQLWHRDFDGPQVIKIFAYLTDVTSEENGPLTFFPAPASGATLLWGRNHLRDEELFRRIDAANRHAMLGPAGTVFAINTHRCIHMGSRVAEGQQRLMLTATFVPAPFLYIGQEPPFAPSPNAGEMERLALST
jgi:hypothetical protein